MKRFLLYVLTFVITLGASAFGTIEVNNLILRNKTKENQTKQDPGIIAPQEKSDGEKVIDNLLSMGGANVSLNLNLSNSTNTLSTDSVKIGDNVNVKFDGDISIIDLENIKLSGKLTVTIDNSVIIINISFLNDVIYLSNETMNIKVETSSLTKIIESLSLFDLNLDLGINLEEFDTSSLLTKLQNLKAEKLENGDLKLPFELTDDITINILADSEFMVKNISLNLDNLAGKSVELEAGLTKKDVTISVPQNEEKYVNITNTLNILDSVKEIISNKKLHLNVNAKYLGKMNASLIGAVDLDFNSKIKCYSNFDVQLNDNVYKLGLNFVDDNIYVALNGLKLKINQDDLVSTLNIILKELNITKEDEDVISYLKNLVTNFDFSKVDLSKININNLLEFTNGEENSIKVKINGNSIGLDFDLNLEIVLNKNNQFDSIIITNLNVLNGKLDVKLGYSKEFEATEINNNDYTDLKSLPEFAKSLFKTYNQIEQNKQISFGLQTDLVNTKFEKDAKDVITKETQTIINLLPASKVKIDFSSIKQTEFSLSDLKAQISLIVKTTTNVYSYTSGVKNATPVRTVTKDHNIDITYLDNMLYIRYNNMYAKISGNSIKGLIDTICEILNIDVSTNTFDNIKNLINSNSKNEMLEKLKLDMLKSILVTETDLNVSLNLEDFGINLDTLKINYDNSGLSKLSINTLKLNNNKLTNLEISLTEFEPITSAPQGNYINLSNIDKLLVAVKNTTEFKDFEINGSINLKLKVLSIDIDWNIPLNAKIKLLENNNFEANIKIGAVPVIPGVNDDAPYKAGNTVSGIYSGLNRILNVYIKDNMVYFHRSEEVPVFMVSNRTFEKKLKIHLDTLLDDPLYYILQYGLGFSSSIMDAINEAVNKERINPIDYSNILKDYSSTENSYSLTLNLKELAENDKLDTMALGIKTVEFNSKMIIGGISFNMYMPLTDSVNITLNSNDLTHINIGSIINFNDMYNYIDNNSQYKEGAEWDAYNGDWQLSNQRKFTLSFETNSSQKVDNIEGIAGAKVALPNLDSYFVDNNIQKITYTFVGWYTTKTFDKDTEYLSNVMPRKDTTLYALWETETQNYVTITFVTNGGEAKPNLTVLENSVLELPIYFDLLIEETDDGIYTKQFDGWYLDEECKYLYENSLAPNQDITLYAKWSIIDSKETYLVNVFDYGEKILSRRVLEGNILTLTGAKFNATTKYYLDDTFTNEIDINNFVMPNNDVNIYIKNMYKVSIVSQYGIVINQELTLYQGDLIQFPSQNSYFEDDGTQTERTIYTFNGYFLGTEKINDLSNYNLPNFDINIVANWSIDVKQYVTVTFNVNWTKPDSWQDNNDNWLGKINCASAPTSVSSFKVLEGTNIDPSKYTSSCTYKYKAMRIEKSYKFVVHSWSVEGTKQLSYNKLATEPKTESYNVLTHLTVTEDTILYAVWKYQK